MKNMVVKEEMVNSPRHYNFHPVEVIDMMVGIFGKNDVAKFCEINAFKYRMRLGLKGVGDDYKTDIEKEQWYLEKMKELLEK